MIAKTRLVAALGRPLKVEKTGGPSIPSVFQHYVHTVSVTVSTSALSIASFVRLSIHDCDSDSCVTEESVDCALLAVNESDIADYGTYCIYTHTNRAVRYEIGEA